MKRDTRRTCVRMWGYTTNNLNNDRGSQSPNNEWPKGRRRQSSHESNSSTPTLEDSTADGLNRLSTMNKWRGIQDERVWECEAIQRTIQTTMVAVRVRTTNDLKDDGDSHHTRASAAHPPNEDSTAETDESNHPIKPRIDAVYVFDYEETARDGLPISMVELTGTW